MKEERRRFVSHHLKTQKINMVPHEEKLRLCNTSEMTLGRVLGARSGHTF